MYFAVDDDFAFFETPVTVTVELEFYDAGGGRLVLDYDCYEPGRPEVLSDHFRWVFVTEIGRTNAWRTATVTLEDVRFSNGQHLGADFRVWAGVGKDLTLRRVTLTRSSNP